MLQSVASRYAVSFFGAAAIVFALFYVMQYLITTANRELDESGTMHFVDFVRVKQDEQIRRKEQKPEKPPEPEEPPPQPPPPSMEKANPQAQSMAVSGARVDPNINLDASGFGLAPTDGEYLPIVKVEPVYPRRALSRGIEGYVVVEFTVTKQGTTKDVQVVEAEPPGMFDDAAVEAAAKFKYKPRIVDGEPIEVPGVRNKITFQIEE